MTSGEGTRSATVARTVPVVGGVLVSLLGVLVLLGWWLRSAPMTSAFLSSGSMKANTAFAILALGISLCLSRAPIEPRRRAIAVALALVALVLAAATFVEYVAAVDLHLDEWLARDFLHAAGTSSPGRMAITTAASLVFAGLALALIDMRHTARLADVAAVLVVATGGAIGLGHAYGSVPSQLQSQGLTSLPTAIALLVLGLGTLCLRPAHGPMSLLLSDGPGGFVARRVLPPTIGVLILLGALRVHYGRMFVGDFGTVLMVLSAIAVVTVVLAFGANALDHADAERKLAIEDTGRARRFVDSILENLPLMVFVKDAESLRFVRFNRAGEELLGFPRDQLIGKNDYDFFPKDEADFFTAKDREVLREAKLVDIPEEPIETKSGRRLLHTRKVTITDEQGTPRYLLGISEDITEQKAVEARIRDLNEHLQKRTTQLEEAYGELESFSYSVSHDLRAPLRHISGFAELLLTRASGLDPASREYAAKISGASERMGKLIEDLLSFSRMGRSDMQHADVDLGRVAADAWREVESHEPGRGIEWQIGAMPVVSGDAAMLRIVFVNLLANAMKYTRSRSPARIEVGSEARDGQWVVFVRDNGVGFDEAYGHKLFGVFQRLHGPDEFEGTGIGLANVQRIVTRHGGRTWAEGAVDQGATFYFSLPFPLEA